jgi:hypothetical protein
MNTARSGFTLACGLLVATTAYAAGPVETSVVLPAIGAVPSGVAERLTQIRPDFDCTDLRFTVKFGRVLASLKSRPDSSTPLSVQLDLVPGPSFAISDTIVNALAAVSGQLQVGEGAGAAQLRIEQFNFLNQAPRSYYDPKKQSLSLILPVVIVEGETRANTVLLVQGSLRGTDLRLDGFRFGMTELIEKAFPSSTSVRDLLGLPEGKADKEAHLDRLRACCQGAWCAQCTIACPPGGCSYVCEVCTPNACNDDCGAGAPECCFGT